jgi:hypothetical protein
MLYAADLGGMRKCMIVDPASEDATSLAMVHGRGRVFIQQASRVFMRTISNDQTAIEPGCVCSSERVLGQGFSG